MNLNRFEEVVKKDLERINVDISKEKTIIFSETLGNHAPGDYYFANEEGYHAVSVGDRGQIEAETFYPNLEDVLFAIYDMITFRISVEYAKTNKKPGEDWRKCVFSKQLDLLRNIDEKYYTKGKNEINEILRKNPYNDSIF